MIVYRPGEWWKALWHFHTSEVIRLLLVRVLLVGLYGGVVATLILKLHLLRIAISREYFSFLGIMLSLLLVFRTNTAYDRYYEGRRLWGQLVSHCRGVAMELNAVLPRDAARSRRYFAALISNFPLALKGALRNHINFEQLEATPDIMDRLHRAENVPTCLVTVLQESMEQLRQADIITPTHLLTIKPHLLALMEVNGSCERIKSTPIPFSYSFFIKMFITIFIGVMPIVLVDTCGYFMVPITMLGAYVMLGLEMIGTEIEQPFGLDSNDLPISQMANKIRVSVHDILSVELHEQKRLLVALPYSIIH